MYDGPDERYSPKLIVHYNSPFRTPNRIASWHSLGDFELDSGRTVPSRQSQRVAFPGRQPVEQCGRNEVEYRAMTRRMAWAEQRQW